MLVRKPQYVNKILIGQKGLIVKKLLKPVIKFVSELDWSPKGWFEQAGKFFNWTEKDAEALKSHIPEYLKIEQEAKANGNWLKMPDGSTWEGDARSWVLLMSKNGQLLSKTRVFTGTSSSPTFQRSKNFPTYNGRSWGSDNKENVYEYARAGKNGDITPITEKDYLAEKAKLDSDPRQDLGKRMAEWRLESRKLYGLGKKEGNGIIYETTYPANAKVSTTNANGRSWGNINSKKSLLESVNKLEKEIAELEKLKNTSKSVQLLLQLKKNNLQTLKDRIKKRKTFDASDNIVTINENNGYDVSVFENVVDNSSGKPMKDIVIHKDVPRKSLLGNNGNFDFNNMNIFRGLPFILLGSTLNKTDK